MNTINEIKKNLLWINFISIRYQVFNMFCKMHSKHKSTNCCTTNIKMIPINLKNLRIIFPLNSLTFANVFSCISIQIQNNYGLLIKLTAGAGHMWDACWNIMFFLFVLFCFQQPKQPVRLVCRKLNLLNILIHTTHIVCLEIKW